VAGLTFALHYVRQTPKSEAQKAIYANSETFTPINTLKWNRQETLGQNHHQEEEEEVD
jgi:hypothetical protein